MKILDSLKKVIDVKFLKFVFVGTINTLVGTAIMFGCYNILGFGYWLSSGLNYFIASILSFFLNKYFTFQNKKRSAKQVLFFILNIVLCYVIAYGLAQPLVGLLLQQADTVVKDNVSLLVGMIFFVFLNYFGQRFFVFRAEDDHPEQDDDVNEVA